MSREANPDRIHRRWFGRPHPAVPLALLAALAITAGCATARKQAQADLAMEGAGDHRPGVPDTAPGDRIVHFDVNGDGLANIVHHYSVRDGEHDVLLRKDIDLNGNGRVDVWRFYEDGDLLVTEAFDLDFDGVIDVWNHYDDRGRLVRKEADLSLDGRTDLWKHYESGRLVRRERDMSGNGRPDYFEFWEDGLIDRIGEDLNGDGTVDRWTRRQRD